MLDVTGADRLTVIANTADDIEIYGAYVSPDPDLVTFWLADRIDARGWGLDGDTFNTMAGMRELGTDVWFNLGDRDLAIGLHRANALAKGIRLTDAHKAIANAFGVHAAVLPMSDRPVRTRILAHGRAWNFQEFMIQAKGEGPIDDIEFHGARNAPATREVLEAIENAAAIVIGPSNPVISIGPILALPAIREALEATAAPVVAVSPLVEGTVLKGPTAAFMQWAGQPLSTEGIVAAYDGLIDGIVADEAAKQLPTLETDVLMDSERARRRVAEETLRFALALG
jgi:LPPG:FO 2-phospho-L-lactate transferase